MPRFDPADEDHSRVGAMGRHVAGEAGKIVTEDDYLQNPNKALIARRTRLRKRLWSTGAFRELNQVCSAVLRTTVFLDESEKDAGS